LTANAEEGRAAFYTMIQGFEKTTAHLSQVASTQQRLAEAVESQLTQHDQLMQSNRELLEYLAALQAQIGVLCTMLARSEATPVPYQGHPQYANPHLQAAQPYDPLAALAQKAAQTVIGGLSGRGRRPPGM
jgi:hypothetical protein